MYDRDDMKFYTRQAYDEGVKDTEAKWKERAEKAEAEMETVKKVLRRAYQVEEGQELLGKVPILIDALAQGRDEHMRRADLAEMKLRDVSKAFYGPVEGEPKVDELCISEILPPINEEDEKLASDAMREATKNLKVKRIPLKTRYSSHTVIHTKTGNEYLFEGTAINCTNGDPRDGERVAIYSRNGEVFVRDLSQFNEVVDGKPRFARKESEAPSNSSVATEE